jgi:hypothetical protein
VSVVSSASKRFRELILSQIQNFVVLKDWHLADVHHSAQFGFLLPLNHLTKNGSLTPILLVELSLPPFNLRVANHCFGCYRLQSAVRVSFVFIKGDRRPASTVNVG